MRMNAHTLVDLDGVSKGFVIDAIVRDLMNDGFFNCYVDWAGDSRAVGTHPDGRPWRSAVIRPPPLSRVFKHWQKSSMSDLISDSDIAYMANYTVEGMHGCAIATSGDYFSVQKYGFHHIANVDEMAVMKASSISVGSVCVAANTCAIADAIATAAMTFSAVEDTVKFLERLKNEHSNTVFGYCVMGRDVPSQEGVEEFTPGIFEVANFAKPDDQSASATISSSDEGEQLATLAHERLFKFCAEIVFGAARVLVDSFVSCSMDPLPLVSFLVPRKLIEHSSLSPESDQNKLQAVLLKPCSSRTARDKLP